ncbi:MAG: helix-turn-helix domain-containing protein [Lutisporaceae bacterium]
MIKIKLSELMGKHRMTQKEVALRTKIRPNTISSIYHEKVRHIDVKHINELCKLFCCQPGDLFEYIEDNEQEC